MIKPNNELKNRIIRLTTKLEEIHPLMCDVFELLPEYKGLPFDVRNSNQGSLIKKMNELLDSVDVIVRPFQNGEFRLLSQKAGVV